MCFSKLKWLVFVEYGETPRRHVEVLSEIASKYDVELVRVRTDVRPGLSLENPNEAFEFSGYQDGLNHVIKQIRAGSRDADRNGDDGRVEVTFLNDTFFYGHPRMVSEGLLRRLMGSTASAQASVVGLKMTAHSAVRDLIGLDYYISTWAFKLAGPIDCVEKVVFFDRGMDIDRFHDQFYSGLPQVYLAHISEWLKPQSFLRGWYKAIPGKPLAENTRRRKEMTIYLENSLSQRLSQLGFKQLDASRIGGALGLFEMRVLKLVDKLSVNSLKLKTRLRYIFTN